MVDHVFVKYMQYGGGRTLGDPKQLEQVIVSQGKLVGYYRDFDKGSIYWTTATDACVVTGKILEVWRKTGAQDGPLGYPVEDQQSNHPGVFYSRFQHGTIFHYQATNECRILLYEKNPAVLWRRATIAIIAAVFIFGAIIVNLQNCAVRYGIVIGESNCNLWNGGILPTILVLLAPIASILANIILRVVWPASTTFYEQHHP